MFIYFLVTLLYARLLTYWLLRRHRCGVFF